MDETPSFDRETAKRKLSREAASRRLLKARRMAARGTAVVCAEIVFLAVLVWALLTFVWGIAIVSGGSMYPTLQHGDLVIYSRLERDCGTGSIIVYDDGGPVVKRVVGTPGDVVELDYGAGVVYVNGQALHEPYAAPGGYLHGDVSYPFTVPPGQYFVLGDNRANSQDSRTTAVGAISERLILGTVIRLYRRSVT